MIISALLPHFLPESFLRPWSTSQTTSTIPVDAKSNTSDVLFEPLIRAYITSQAELQTVKTLSGDLLTGGLSEPKYLVDGTAFNDPWGRPQR